MAPTSGSGLKVLIEEARRRDEDTRPELLRALVGLYLRQPSHSAAEQARFATLARRLLPIVEPAAAARAVRDLAARSDLPRDFVLELVAGPIAFAGPLLRLSPVLEDADLAAIAEHADPEKRAAIGARRDVSPIVAKQLASQHLASQHLASEHLASRRAAGRPSAGAMPERAMPAGTRPERGEPAPMPPAIAEIAAEIAAGIAVGCATESAAAFSSAPEPDPDRSAPAPARPDYFSASPEERAALVARLVTLPPLPLAERVAPADGALVAGLLDLAKSGEPAGIAALLEPTLGITHGNAARIVADESGQAFAVAARALGLSFAVLSRVLFRLHPATGRSPAEMSRLADMFEALPLASAQHLVAAWRSGRRGARERTEDVPSMRSYGLPYPAHGAKAATGEARQPG